MWRTVLDAPCTFDGCREHAVKGISSRSNASSCIRPWDGGELAGTRELVIPATPYLGPHGVGLGSGEILRGFRLCARRPLICAPVLHGAGSKSALSSAVLSISTKPSLRTPCQISESTDTGNCQLFSRFPVDAGTVGSDRNR